MPKIVNHHKAPIHHNIDESMELIHEEMDLASDPWNLNQVRHFREVPPNTPPNIQETESRTLLPGTRTWAQCPSTTSTLDLNTIHCCISHGKRTDAPRGNRTCLHRSWQSHHKDLATKKNHGWIGWKSIESKTQFCIGFDFPNKRCVYLSILLYILLLLKLSCNRWMRTSTTRHGNIREPVLNLSCKP